MKIEQIEKDKIQITFSQDDLNNNNLNLHSIMCNSQMTQKFFSVLLDIAEKEMGFETRNYDISIETLILNDSNYILTISRQKNKEKNLHKFPIINRKNYSFSNSFLFNNFDDFYEFYNKVKFLGIYKKSLFYFNNNFYYISNYISDTSKLLLLEYATPVKTPCFLIKNYGKQIL